MHTSTHCRTDDGVMRESSLPCPDGCGRRLVECHILGRWVAMPCQCRIDGDRLEEEMHGRIAGERSLLESGIPVEFRGIEPDSRWNDSLAKGGWFWLAGDDSTMRACAILKGWIASGRSGLLTSEMRANKSMFDVPLLVLDGFGYHRPERWEAARLREIVEHRSNRSLPLIVSSTVDRSRAARNFCNDWDDSKRAIEIMARRCVNG